MSTSTIEEYPWFATNEKLNVQIVTPLKRIMGDWVLCRSESGTEWFIPVGELQNRKQAGEALGDE